MAGQLDRIGIGWERVAAHDKLTVDEALLAREVASEGHVIAMGRGSRACALTNFDIYRRMLAEDIPAALILQDDVALSPDIAPFLETLDWVPGDVHVVQFEKYGRPVSRRLMGPSLGRMPVAGRSLHRLHSRTAGAACYLVTQEGARRVIAEKPLLRMPIDHFLFSPNVSPLFDRLGVAVVRPALARQSVETLGSDMEAERTKQPRDLSARLRRLWQDLNRVPGQVIALGKGARLLDYSFDLGTRRG